MTVAGNLAFQSGAFYVVQVNPTTASTTNVSGTASLAGTVVANLRAGQLCLAQLHHFDGRRRASPARSTRSPPWACRPGSERD